MTPDQFSAHCERLHLSTGMVARLVGADRRTVQRWAVGTTPIPRSVAIVLRLMERPTVRQTIERLVEEMADA